MADARHLKKCFFGHNSAADCPISVKFCVGKEFFSQNFGNETDIAFHRTYFFVILYNTVWASASGAFRIVSDTLVFYIFIFIHRKR